MVTRLRVLVRCGITVANTMEWEDLINHYGQATGYKHLTGAGVGNQERLRFAIWTAPSGWDLSCSTHPGHSSKESSKLRKSRVTAELRAMGFVVGRHLLETGGGMVRGQHDDGRPGSPRTTHGPGSSGALCQWLIFHSDQCSQYAAIKYRKAQRKAGITCNMSRRANGWDNAVAESFFATLKKEFVVRTIFTTWVEAKTRIVEYIETFYNRQRRHSNKGYLSPVDFENQFYNENMNQ